MKNTKTVIPIKMRAEMSTRPEYKTCMLYNQMNLKTGLIHVCGGDITWEHAVIFAGNKIQEPWAIIAICERGHAINNYQDAGTMIKELNQWVAYNRATDAELLKYSSASLSRTKLHERAYLNKIYGEYKQISPVVDKSLAEAPKTPHKPFWYPITHPERQMVEKATAFHKEIYDVNMTPFEMIRHMIDSYQILIDNFREIADVYPEIYEKIRNPRAPKQVEVPTVFNSDANTIAK